MQILKGMKDMYFDSIDKFDFIVSKAIDTCYKYGYTRISTPILEELDLFKRSAGDESDVVSKEMYDFKDKGGREIALRPEGTAGIVRAYLDAKLYKAIPVTKWFYYGPMYRYEAPQKGRYREFNQFGVECFGIKNPMQDAEIIKMACDFLENIGLKDLVVEINSLGNKETIRNYTKILQDYLIKNFENLSETSKIRCYKNPLRVLDSKEDEEILKNAPKLSKYFDEESKNYFNEVLEYLSKFGVKYEINEKLVRGLDYYSDTVFEIKSNNLGAQSTVLAGGRYDRLLEQLSGLKIPAIGFAAGIERLTLLVDKIEKKEKTKVYIVYFKETKDYLFKVLNVLRKNDLQIDYDLDIKGFNAQMKKANKFNADKVIILGLDEVRENKVSIKDFKTGNQKLVNFENLKEVK